MSEILKYLAHSFKCFECQTLINVDRQGGIDCHCGKCSRFPEKDANGNFTGELMIIGLSNKLEIWIDETYDADILFELRDMTYPKGGKRIFALDFIPDFVKPNLKETIDYLEKLTTFA